MIRTYKHSDNMRNYQADKADSTGSIDNKADNNRAD